MTERRAPTRGRPTKRPELPSWRPTDAARRLYEQAQRLPGWAIPTAIASGLFLQLYLFAVFRYEGTNAGFDLGYFRQAAWLIGHGESAFITIRGLHILGDHASFVLYPISWLVRPFPTVHGLLAVQSAALATGVFPLYAYAVRTHGLPRRSGAALCGAYGLYPALQNINLADFHPEVVALPALLGAVYYSAQRRWLPYGILLGIVLLSKEDLALVVAALGVFLVIRGDRRLGAATTVAGLGVFAFDVLVVLPHFAGTFIHTGLLSQFGDSLGEALRTMLTQPRTVIDSLLTFQHVHVVVALLAPVLFLPLLAPLLLLPAVPQVLINFLSQRPGQHTIDFQYTVALIPFVFAAATAGLRKLGENARNGFLLLLLLCSVAFHSLELSRASILHQPWEWPMRGDADQARVEAAELVPADAEVAASDSLLPLLASRQDVYAYPAPFSGYPLWPAPHTPEVLASDPVSREERGDDVDYLVLDFTDDARWQPTNRDPETGEPGVNPLLELHRILQDEGFGLVFAQDGILVYERG